MLARGILCRLAADVPKTSTHDLSHLARLLHRNLAARNGASSPSTAALSYACRLVIADARRSYATARATEPTETVKKAVKKSVAKKPAPKKTAAKKKAAPKRRTPTKRAKAKPKPKKKPVKKVLTPEEKEKAQIAALRKTALREPKHGKLSAYNVFFAESQKGNKGQSIAQIASETPKVAEKYKNLTPAEKEHYNHLANEKNAQVAEEYKAWVNTFTPEQIRLANNARALLRRKLTKGTKVPTSRKYPPHTSKIIDHRQITRPASPYIRFSKDRMTSGDFKSISTGEAAKLIGNEWKSLSAGEKKKYEDAHAVELEAYKREYQRTFGHDT